MNIQLMLIDAAQVNYDDEEDQSTNDPKESLHNITNYINNQT